MGFVQRFIAWFGQGGESLQKQVLDRRGFVSGRGGGLGRIVSFFRLRLERVDLLVFVILEGINSFPL